MADNSDENVLLRGIPGKQDILVMRAKYQVAAFLRQLNLTFRNDGGDDDYFFNAVANVRGWSWAVDVPYRVELNLQTAIRDVLSEKWYDKITFSDYEAFSTGFTRVTIFVESE